MPTPSATLLAQLNDTVKQELQAEQTAFINSPDKADFDQSRYQDWLDIQGKLRQLELDMTIIKQAESLSDFFKSDQYHAEVIEIPIEEIISAMIELYKKDIRLEGEKLRLSDDPSQFNFEPTEKAQANIEALETIALNNNIINQAKEIFQQSGINYDTNLGVEWEASL